MAKTITVKELSGLLHKTTRTLYRWIHEGALFPHAYRVKRSWYIPMIDLKKLRK